MIQVFDPKSNKTGKAGIIYVGGKKVIFAYLHGKRIFPSSIIDEEDYNLELVGNNCSTCVDAKKTSTVTFAGTTFADSQNSVGTTRVMIPSGLVGDTITVRALPFLGYKFKHWINNTAIDESTMIPSLNSTFTYRWPNYTTLTAVGEIDYDHCFIVFENVSMGEFDIINNNPMANDRHLEISYTWSTYKGIDNEKKYLGKLMAKIPVRTPLYINSSDDYNSTVNTNIIVRSWTEDILDWSVASIGNAGFTTDYLNPSIVEEDGCKYLHLDTLPGGGVYVVHAYKAEDDDDTQITMYIDDNNPAHNTGTGTIQVWLDGEEISPVETVTTYKLYRVKGKVGQTVKFKATPDEGSTFGGWDMGAQSNDMPDIQEAENSFKLRRADNETNYHARFVKPNATYTLTYTVEQGKGTIKVKDGTNNAEYPLDAIPALRYVIIQAVPNEGYEFSDFNWPSDFDNNLFDNRDGTIEVTDNIKNLSIGVWFSGEDPGTRGDGDDPVTYVSATINSLNGTYVIQDNTNTSKYYTGNGDIPKGSTIKIIATPNSGYSFSSFTNVSPSTGYSVSSNTCTFTSI